MTMHPDPHQDPSAQATDPHRDLSDAQAARDAIVLATNRSKAFHLAESVLLGLALGLAVFAQSREPVFWVPVAVVGVACLVMLVWDARTRRRQGRITDGRAAASAFAGMFIAMLPMFIMSMIRPEFPVPGWWAVIVGCAATLFGYVYMRWDQAYQSKRLRAGDYGPYDLT